MWFVESRNTSEEDLVVILIEHDSTSHKEEDTTEKMELQDWNVTSDGAAKNLENYFAYI